MSAMGDQKRLQLDNTSCRIECGGDRAAEMGGDKREEMSGGFEKSDFIFRK